ncbi:MAG: glycoside hydrolase family 57 protein, partial [Verrucomicrobiae bacterium]|nr:glycoside hydrolase family 57 protein [Verrucomicrobiae bacterium]
MLNVIFLWHMHQPYYVNPLTKTAEMPWVRLHAVKGYLDMISVLEDFPNVRVNFNMTPVLVKQILEFNEGSVKDLWFEASLKPAADLSAQDKNLILENFFKINWDNMLKPHLRFAELLYKRGQSFSPGQSSSVADRFNEQDFRDVQTWFNLGWCGYRAEHYFPRLRELKIKGSGFSESEKLEVLDIHRQILRLVLKKYGEMEQAGRVELTTTPFYHPILPLVYDSELARRCMPGRKLPRPFSYPEDALSHLVRAADQHEQVFGRRPRGLWPSEGSVAPELIPLMRKAGFEYFCTDEANLFNSLNHDPAWAGKTADHLELFQGWSAQYEGAKINAVFRERPLSDFIGFVASKNSPQQAADHLIFNLEHIATVAHEPNAMIALILDGENAWEHFADGGEGFLRNLYGRLSDHPVLRTKCISDYFAEFPQTKTTTTLHTGSWINSDFDIWIGDEAEENVAWDMLGQTRKFLEEQVRGGRLSDEAKNRAFEEIYAA